MMQVHTGVYSISWQELFCCIEEKTLHCEEVIIGIYWGLGVGSVSQSPVLILAQKLKWGNENRWYHKVGSNFEYRGAVKYCT